MTSTETEVKVLLEDWSGAVRMKDIDQLMSLYAPDAVYFDLVPPLRFAGAAEIRRNFLRWFGSWQSSIGVELRELNVSASGDVANAFMLDRASGTLTDGREVDYWVRATVCCERSDRGWLIKHEHISLPVDIPSGRAVRDLVP
jgi:ketosteroid isomerase-like protein